MNKGDLATRALAAASSARAFGFFETAEALIEIARQCECGIDPFNQIHTEQSAAAGWLDVLQVRLLSH
jgi:hypothetical protein